MWQRFVCVSFVNPKSFAIQIFTRQVLLTLRETTMLQIMNAITDKPDWNIKVCPTLFHLVLVLKVSAQINDEAIVQKWRDEILASEEDVTDKMLNWCINELRYKATRIPPAPVLPPPTIVFNGDVVKSDFAVSPELKAELQKAVTDYEEKIPPRLKDWHPGSNEQVWDLVHPSLFPLVYGRTRILSNGETTTLDDCIRRCGEGEVTPVPPKKETVEIYHQSLFSNKHQFSAKFQWLPCEVDISGAEAR